ncbi:hypothetical protein EJ06DRAFT_530807 [Trichodelitschia bisporula]|uniref:GPI anchored protein n=1 Tax=Trichodelitschia bisporula TaxID=703511 RepID=A0A6G1HVW0_9PEZI|nr:hypothetical protein EJ06DRAFT_530807 [Trichodelitschia bisporula]
MHALTLSFMTTFLPSALTLSLMTASFPTAFAGAETRTTATPTGPTVQAFLGFVADPQILVASIKSASPSATVMEIGCPDGTSGNDCGFNPPLTLTQGPTTAVLVQDRPDYTGFTMSIGCSLDTKASTAVCVSSMGGAEANFPGVETGTVTGTDYGFSPVTVTAGAEKLSAASGSATTGKTSGTATGKATGTTKSGASASGTAASASGSSTGSSGAGRVVGSGIALGVVALAICILA